VTYVLLIVGGLLLAEKVWKHAAVVCFFRRPCPVLKAPPRLVSILQPILSGDPTLSASLEHNLSVAFPQPVEFLWLVDTTDLVGQAICKELMNRHPESEVRLILLPPPEDRCSPKMVKLIAGLAEARGDVFCVLDDDTMLPADGLGECLPYLDEPGVGLAFGLPYYVSFPNLWSALVACFVNSHSLLTYVPAAVLTEPFTINGMFYVFRREVHDAVGGFGGLQRILADDFAVAQHFRTKGYRLAQTPLRHGISTHVRGPSSYLRLLHRWFVFPRETVMKALPPRDLAVAYGVGMVSVLAPLLLLGALLAWPSWELAGLCLGYAAYHYAIFAHFNIAYLRRSTPWRWSWLVPVIQVLLPLQLLAAVVSPQRINWRGHVMQVEKGGGFRLLRRRAE
jgi:ceramide glucosyltransferase